MWKATAGQVNRFRKNILHLPPTNLHRMGQSRVPFICQSPALRFERLQLTFSFARRQLFFGRHAQTQRLEGSRLHLGCASPPLSHSCLANPRRSLAGYWFLDDPPDKVWSPPAGLLEFIQEARDDGKAIIYVGFGSIVVRSLERSRSLTSSALTRLPPGSRLYCRHESSRQGGSRCGRASHSLQGLVRSSGQGQGGGRTARGDLFRPVDRARPPLPPHRRCLPPRRSRDDWCFFARRTSDSHPPLVRRHLPQVVSLLLTSL